MSRSRLGVTVLVLLVAGASPSAASALRVPAISPAPATPDAAPRTQISILGVAPARIRSVSAVGARSGRHAGRLRPYSGGRGASFVPGRPFAQGERVDATVRVRGLAPIRVSFTIARLAPIQPLIPITRQQPSKLQHFASRPSLLPPKIRVLERGAQRSGDIFLTPLPSPVVRPGSNNVVTISPVGPGGPMIVDGAGNLVWFRQLASPNVAANLRMQRYLGRLVLTWWQGGVTPSAFGLGEGIIADSSYRTLATVRAGNGYAMDLHEFTLTSEGDALFTVYSPVLVHLPGAPPGTLTHLLDAIVQDVDIRTGLVVWEWHGLGHIPLADSYATPQNSASYDAFHINAIQPLSGDRLLVSARDTSAIYEIDRASGRIVWTLGGKASSFRLGPGARFYFQHDAQMLPSGQIAMFDDEAGPPMTAPSSRGLILALNLRRRIATVVHSYRRPADTSAQSEGSLQIIPGGDVFLGFGSEPSFSEFTASGRMVFDAALPQDDGSYRAYRFAWSATPATKPDVVARRVDATRIAVDVSWNGATRVARWQVLAGRAASALSPRATVRSRGFETHIELASSAPLIAVRALDASGRVLVSSGAVRDASP